MPTAVVERTFSHAHAIRHACGAPGPRSRGGRTASTGASTGWGVRPQTGHGVRDRPRQRRGRHGFHLPGLVRRARPQEPPERRRVDARGIAHWDVRDPGTTRVPAEGHGDGARLHRRLAHGPGVRGQVVRQPQAGRRPSAPGDYRPRDRPRLADQEPDRRSDRCPAHHLPPGRGTRRGQAGRDGRRRALRGSRSRSRDGSIGVPPRLHLRLGVSGS